ncbi:hypothetical protein F511_02136 [Dorcoceras hygrometricum]|uniref:Uncharacterized protein n=1 Tax=Dorcoceras hygrometricum TaxID=472368 RepID=A0A2Z7DBU5_9LAMI|nr:hypothetical protein F511_02136 [Dorcoceras hygrometricum]
MASPGSIHNKSRLGLKETGIDQLALHSVQLGYLKILQMGNTDPTTQKQEKKYEVKPQYEELSKQLIMQHAIINAMKCMRAIKDRIARPVYQLANHLSRASIPHTVYQPGKSSVRDLQSPSSHHSSVVLQVYVGINNKGKAQNREELLPRSRNQRMNNRTRFLENLRTSSNSALLPQFVLQPITRYQSKKELSRNLVPPKSSKTEAEIDEDRRTKCSAAVPLNQTSGKATETTEFNVSFNLISRNKQTLHYTTEPQNDIVPTNQKRRRSSPPADTKSLSKQPAAGIQLAVGPQQLWLRNHNFGLAQRIMVKLLATSPHDPLGITDSACKNQLVVVSVQYGPFNPYIPIRSTTIGKSRVVRDPTAMHTSWRSNSDIASVTR